MPAALPCISISNQIRKRVCGSQMSVSSADLWGQLMAASAFATIPTVIIFILLQRHFIAGLLAGSAR